MKIQYEFIAFIYFFCVIVISIILFSFVFNIITKRLFGTNPYKTKIYYLEIFGIWLTMAFIMFNIRTNLNKYSKKHFTKYMKSNGENEEYTNLYNQIDELEKFDMIVIIGFFIIFVGSNQHTYNEKLTLLNEDIGLIGEIIK